METLNKNIFLIALRYISLAIIGIFAFNFFYIIFTPLTIYPSFYLLKLFFPVSLAGDIIKMNNLNLIIAKSCVAGAAYFLLTILNLTTPMSLPKRIFSLLFSYFSFLAINLSRIFIFSILFINSSQVFLASHFLFWYIFSTLIVFFTWFLTIKVFKIKKIPFYSDFKFLLKIIKRKNR